MDIIIERILSHPLLSFTLALLCILLLFAILKGLIKIVFFLLALGLLYFGYINFLQEDYPLPKIDEGWGEKWEQLIEPYKNIDLNVSFFSLLAVVGVALGVNVMIVVIAFMQGFQQKFRNDIIDAQGHGRINQVPWGNTSNWQGKLKEIEDFVSIQSVMPYLQAQLILQRDNYHSIPFSMGIEPDSGNSVLQIDSFLRGGFLRMIAHDGEDITPVPTIDTLEDEVVFVSNQVSRRLGVRPAYIIRFDDENKSRLPESSTIEVSRVDPFVESAHWEITFENEDDYIVKSDLMDTPIKGSVSAGPINVGHGAPVFEAVHGDKPFEKNDRFKFYVSAADTIEVYSPSMIEKSTKDEMVPPREVKVGGIFEVPWQGFHTEALLGTVRFMQDMQGDDGRIDGFYFKTIDKVARSESGIAACSHELETLLGDGWNVIPWFVENAWFFDLLKFEEYLMILIMIPIGLVAAFAIAIALLLKLPVRMGRLVYLNFMIFTVWIFITHGNPRRA